jgi:signal transduction histidine kinase/DNA-binding response OmpR family regulator
VIDGLPRLTSYRAIAGYPLYAYAGFEEAAFMAETRQRQQTYFSVAGIMSLLLVLLGSVAHWQTNTQERARRNAERSNRLKSEFLATISHELRTPMNGVLGTLALLEDGTLTPDHARQVTLAHRSATALLTLLDDLLDFSKLEAGKIVIDAAIGDLRRLVEEVVEMLLPAAAAKELEMVVTVSPAVPRWVLTDTGRLRQILFNLLGNAVKFTASGHVTIRVERGAAADHGQFLLDVTVEDSGIGIVAEALPTLFDQFTQADSSVTRRYGGTGLGLAICRQLCTALGGGIEVHSVSGRGSIFHFWIACAESSAAADSDPAMPPTASIVPADLRVLVVDDHAINREVLCGLVGRAGHRYETAPDGVQAVAMQRAHGFDLVLMDIQMPELDGLTATAHIRALPAPARLVPIIAVTAHASPSSRQECLDAGMDGMISKPVRPDRLFAEIANVLRARPPAHRAGRSAAAAATGAAAMPAHLIDTAQTRDLREALGDALWRDMLVSFRDAAITQINILHQQVAAGDDPAAPAHALKGIAFNMGAQELGDRARMIETAPPAEAARLVATLETCLTASFAALQGDEARHAA